MGERKSRLSKAVLSDDQGGVGSSGAVTVNTPGGTSRRQSFSGKKSLKVFRIHFAFYPTLQYTHILLIVH